MAKITYTNKVARRTLNVDDSNKITAADMNEIKASVNLLYDAYANLRTRTAVAIPASELGPGYKEISGLIGLTPDEDFFVYSDGGSGVLLKVNDGYTFNAVNGRLTMAAGDYRLVYFKPVISIS